MSPFAEYLQYLRKNLKIRQNELANLIGCKASYISAIEIGLKGPPSDEIVERLIEVTSIGQEEQQALRKAAKASQRTLVIDNHADEEVFWMLHELRERIDYLHPTQIELIRLTLSLNTEPRTKTPDHVLLPKKQQKRQVLACNATK